MMNVLGLAYDQRYFHPVDAEDYFVFALLRDRDDRFLSGFHELSKRKSDVTVSRSFWRFTRTEDRIRALIDELEANLERSPYSFDPHDRSQWWFLTYDDGSMYRIDQFYDVANLKQVASGLRARSILPRLSTPSCLSMPRLNQSESSYTSL